MAIFCTGQIVLIPLYRRFPSLCLARKAMRVWYWSRKCNCTEIRVRFAKDFWCVLSHLARSAIINNEWIYSNVESAFTIGGGHNTAACTIALATSVNETAFNSNIMWDWECKSPSNHERSLFITEAPGTYYMRWVSFSSNLYSRFWS